MLIKHVEIRLIYLCSFWQVATLTSDRSILGDEKVTLVSQVSDLHNQLKVKGKEIDDLRVQGDKAKVTFF